MGKKFWSFKSKTEDQPAELLLYGEISSSTWYGDEVTPKQFKEDLDALGDVDQIDVYINSPGGDIFAGQAIYSMLERHKARITVYVDGLAASAASVIAMVGDRIIMPKNAMMMIHHPWTIAMGNAKELRKLADELDKVAETIVRVYQDRSGMTRSRIIELMDAETWFTADEAVSCGLADEVEEQKQIAASLNANILILNGQAMDISKYRNIPKSAFSAKEKNLTDRYEMQIKANQNWLGAQR